ncbi:protein-tyrosine-phosphatase [Nocardia nova]|uniref:tyrosine-protein phosphatase n=1 Tax=Nocardia nova TaxID=37330 RepID=UPI000CEA6E75|nr:tyrosine-protein phosphatase [Nocardia nova]PPJ14434.1 protein-tyrosine-phosphatase [Nocardia nova]
MTSAEIHDPPEGLLGFRPVAGLRTTDGRRVADGLLFRSATPQFVGDEPARRFTEASGLRTIIDLRLPHEAANEGSGGFTATGVRIVNVPFTIRKTVSASSAVAPMTSPDPLVGTYMEYLSDRGAFRRIVEALLRPEGLPALTHCTVGKDRTGVAYAIVLDAVGVVRSDIAADYARRSDDVAVMMNRLRGMASYGSAVDVYPPEAYRASPATVFRFLAWVDTVFGGSRRYLGSVGVSEAQLTALADRILVPDNEVPVSQIARSATIEAPATDVWKIVGDVATVHAWVPALDATSFDGDLRIVRFSDGSEAREEIVAHSDDDRSYTYRYLDGPVALREHSSALTVGPHYRGGGSLVTWTATLQASAEVVRTVDDLYAAGLARLAELLADR